MSDNGPDKTIQESAKDTGMDVFLNTVEETQKQPWYRQPLGFALALNTPDMAGEKVITTNLISHNWNENFGTAAVIQNALHTLGRWGDEKGLVSEEIIDVDIDLMNSLLGTFAPFIEHCSNQNHQNVYSFLIAAQLYDQTFDRNKAYNEFLLKNLKIVFVYEDSPVQSIESAYLKLIAMSKGKTTSLNTDGIEDILVDIAWTADNMCYTLEDLRNNETQMKLANNYPCVIYTGKYPKYLQHIIPAADDAGDKIIGQI